MDRRAGFLFALLAAFGNGSVGSLVSLTGTSGLPESGTAFFKCALAAIAVFPFAIWQSGKSQGLMRSILSLPHMAAGFFGVFAMNTFEIRAYSHQSVATTVLMFLVGSTVTTLVLSRIFFRRRLTIGRFTSISLSLIGTYLVLSNEVGMGSFIGPSLGLAAGASYGSYLIIAETGKVSATMPSILSMTFWGTMLLLPSYVSNEMPFPAPGTWLPLVALAIVPTVLGYYFTTLAVSYSSASDTQTVELSEPVFAALLAWMVLGQEVTQLQCFGGLVVLTAILSGNRLDRFVESRGSKNALAERG